MPEVWTIKGQAGKTVDETSHTLAELQAQNSTVQFATLASDQMSWRVWLKNTAESATLIPDLGQQITLYRDGGRFFTGTVTKRRVRLTGRAMSADITVEGPWWDLKQIFLSSEIPDQAGDESERSAYVLATGSPATHLAALIARAIALGAPVRAGSIATVFDIPRLSLRNISFAEAFAEVMRWVADGHLFFDYTGSDTVYPALCMQRRGAADAITLAAGSAVISSGDISPRLDLQVEEVSVMYATRETVDNARKTTWQTDTAGTATTGLPRRQPVLVSGPELDTWLPNDITDSVVVHTAAISGNIKDILVQYDERIRATGITSFSLGPYHVTTNQSIEYDLPQVTTRLVDRDGNNLPGDYDWYLTKGEPKDWWTKDGIDYISARLTATLFGGLSTWLYVDDEPAEPDWPAIVGATAHYWLSSEVSGLSKNRVYAFTSSVVVPVVNQQWTTDTTLIRSEDYAFVNPPTGLAANLLASQNWLPHEGSVTYVAETIPAGHAVGGILNITGLLTEMETMGAMISGHSTQLATGETTYTLGAPGRMAYRDLVNRFRQSGADNIIWLTGGI